MKTLVPAVTAVVVGLVHLWTDRQVILTPKYNRGVFVTNRQSCWWGVADRFHNLPSSSAVKILYVKSIVGLYRRICVRALSRWKRQMLTSECRSMIHLLANITISAYAGRPLPETTEWNLQALFTMSSHCLIPPFRVSLTALRKMAVVWPLFVGILLSVVLCTWLQSHFTLRWTTNESLVRSLHGKISSNCCTVPSSGCPLRIKHRPQVS